MEQDGLQADFRQLYEAYHEAWNEYCSAVTVLQSLSPDAASGGDWERAREREAQAEIVYRTKRNQLAEHMIASLGETSRTRRSRLEQLAYEVWQERGRQDGGAEADWYRAEALMAK